MADTARDKAQGAIRTSGEYVRQNPWPTLLGALFIGASLGILLTQRERKRTDLLDATRNWVGSARDNVAQKLHGHRNGGFFGRLPSHQDSLLEQAQQVGRKLRFW